MKAINTKKNKKLRFGKYKGWSLGDAVREDPAYFRFLAQQWRLDEALRGAIVDELNALEDSK